VTEYITRAGPLLPYLGGKKYAKLCETLGAKHPVNLVAQNDGRVHALFVEIVRILKYFSLKSLDIALSRFSKERGSSIYVS
jgi:hypothetical protein